MTGFVIRPPARPSIPVAGGGLFPVRRIFCVGRNYADHAREMGHEPELPFFFTKPADALLTGGADLPYPSATADLHFEGELVVALGGRGRDIAAEDAGPLVWGHAAGIDFTRRDLQAEAKKLGGHGTWPRALTTRRLSARCTLRMRRWPKGRSACCWTASCDRRAICRR